MSSRLMPPGLVSQVSGLSVCFLASYLGILASSHLSEISSLPFFSFSLSGYARSKTFIIFACFCFAWVKEQPKAFHIWNEGQKFPSLKSGISTQLAHLEERSQSLRKALIEAQHSSRSSYVLKVEIPDMSTCTSTVEGQMELDKEDMQGSNQTWHRLLCIYVQRFNIHHDSNAMQTASKDNSMITQVRSV